MMGSVIMVTRVIVDVMKVFAEYKRIHANVEKVLALVLS